jgi:hypothetical protein
MRQYDRVSGGAAVLMMQAVEVRRESVVSQPMLSGEIVRLSLRTSGETGGRPPRRQRDFRVNKVESPCGASAPRYQV